MNPQLQDYIKQARSTGQSDEQIKQALTQSGWSQPQINEAFGVPTPSNIAMPPPAPSSGSSLVSADFLDKKTKDTVMWSVVGYFAKSVIVAIAGVITVNILVPSTVNVYGVPISVGRPGFNLNIFNLVISSLIYGAIAGLILSKLYSKIQEINRRFFGGWFNTLYRLIFYPSIIGGVLALIFTGGISASLFGNTGYGGYFFMFFLVTIVAEIIGSFIYAKLMVNKVGQYYS